MLYKIKNILLLAVLFLTAAVSHAQLTLERDTVSFQKDKLGNTFMHIKIPSRPLHYFVYKFKMSKQNKLTAVFANEHIPDLKRNAIDNVAKRESKSGNEVIAAINGDFFSYKNGEVEGFQIIDKEVVYAHSGKTKYGINIDKRNRISLDSVYFEGSILAENKSYSINAVNSLKYKDSTHYNLVFNHYANFNDFKPEKHKLVLIEKTGKKYRFKSILTAVPEKINEDQYLLALNPEKAEAIINYLKKSKFKVELALKDKQTHKSLDVLYHISGGVPLVIDGKEALSSDETGSYRGKIHPRTALGVNTKTQTAMLLVVDGRSDISNGVNYEEMAQLFIENNCTDALNLDGGGSSALWLHGEIKNQPSDKEGPRPCLNYLLLSRVKK